MSISYFRQNGKGNRRFIKISCFPVPPVIESTHGTLETGRRFLLHPPHETPMKIIDTHAHMNDIMFDPDRTDVMERARDAGITGIVSVSERIEDVKRTLELADEYQIIKPAAGLYPKYLDPLKAERIITFVREHRRDFAAIGEIGLDFRLVNDESDREIQKTIFASFIRLGKELDIPLNVHSRSAGKYAIKILLENDAKKVQLHAFDGKASNALPGVEAGYFFSIPPSVIRSKQEQKLVKRLPLSSLLLETDSPVLGPIPGKRNEPANIRFAVRAVAEIKNVSREEIIETTFLNTTRLYGNLD